MKGVRCTLISNPASGTGREHRLGQIHSVAKALSAEGHSVTVELTTGPGSASVQARMAASQGADVVFACGGDGTVHEVVQGLIFEAGNPATALGIIPVGSANALARHLRLPHDPVSAALAQIHGRSQTLPVGKLECDGQVRYFTVMAGAGPDGALVYRMHTNQKKRLGRGSYYLHAAHLYATRGFPCFEVEYLQAGAEGTAKAIAVAVMAVRVRDLGGLFGGLTSRTASIEASELELYLVRPPAWLSLPLWFVSSWLRLQGHNPFFRHISAVAFACTPLNGAAIHVEADGEWIGRAPFRVSIVPGALRIRMPECTAADAG
jgi:YegS/Rv2252/BmrU family lipid kinase